MKSTLLLFSLSFIFLSIFCSAKPIVIANKKGQKLNATLLNLADGKVSLEKSDGKTFTIPFSSLSEDSQKLVKETWNSQKAAFGEILEPLNEALGQPLFNDQGTLWSQPAEEVSKRLEWPLESKTPYTSSYRLYTRPGYTFAGTHPRTVVAYGDENGLTESLSLIYSNKGDTLSKVGSGEDHFKTKNGKSVSRKTFEGAMLYDMEMISNALTKVLGEGTFQRILAQGSKTIKVQRWDWNGHAFLLAHAKKEYVSLRIVKTAFADNGGKSERIDDGAMRIRLKKNVVTQANGDIYIDNIPMVDQGPKGYCAPATFERAMRHAGVAADMYLLATLATVSGGGTNTARLYDEVAFTTRSKGGRTAREINIKSLQPSRIKKYIDKGVPLLWRMRSLKKYNEIANERSKERKTTSDFSGYATRIASEAQENAKKLRAQGNFHICMVVGYNEATGEIAVSDSWGNRYNRRWIHYLEADAVSNNSGFVIDL